MKGAPLLVSGLLVAGCRFAATVQPPPVYNEQCEPEPAFWLDYARETVDLAPEGYIPSDPEAALQKAYEEIDRYGLRLVKKKTLGIEGYDGFSMTLPDTILLADNWDEKSVESKAITLWHELVHKRQWDRLGREAFIARYAVTTGKWSIEVPAYRENFRVRKLFGVPDEENKARMPRSAEYLYEKYILRASMPECTKETSVAIWRQDFQ